MMDIYTLIHNDHEAAKAVINQMDEAPSPTNKLALFDKLKAIVLPHNDAEASSFYIALDARRPTRRFAESSRSEHDVMARLFDQLSNRSLSHEKWEADFATLREELLEHMQKEEGEVFDLARKIFTPQIAIELAVSMQQLRQMRRQLLSFAS